MQIPDAPRTSEASESSLSENTSRPEGPALGAESGSEPPTIVRTSSSSARRAQATSQLHSLAQLPQPGELIGTFHLEEAIGAGGMGAVFRARDGQLDREVALKLLPLDQTADPEIVQRFYQEGRAAARLDHENIARVYSIGQDGPHHFIAFEFIEGVTVRRRVDQDGPLSVSEAVDITLQIAQALVHAAGRAVVHRDIKPSNIILTPQGRAKLVDMGLARRFEREADHGLTQSGMTLGTFDYISPEQARDPRDVDVRSDLYSLGCTLFHMLSGRPPFPGGTVLQKLLQHQEEPAPDIRSLNPHVPNELARIITKLMAKDRDRRYQSPEQLVRDLLSFAGAAGLELSQAEHHAWYSVGHTLTWQHHQVWFFPLLAFIVVVAGLVWWGRESAGPAPPEPRVGPIRSPRSDIDLSTKATSETKETAVSAVMDEPEFYGSAPISSAPPNITVRPGDDLLAVIAAAPRRATITLIEDGTYLLGARTGGFHGAGALQNRDVTIRAESGTRPVLRFAPDARLADRPLPALLPLAGGNVTIEGLVFELDPEEDDERVAAILAEDVDLTLRNCSFRQSAVRAGSHRAALRIRVIKHPSAGGDRPPAVFADTCHFDGGQVGIQVEGPADLLLRDCTMGPGAPMIWLDDKRATSQVPVDLRLRHSSLMAGGGPIFLFEGALARVSVDDCVIASAGASRSLLPTLVAVDNPRGLIWRGRSNLYAKIGAFLESTRTGDGRETIIDFEHWQETATEFREKGSVVAAAPIWKAAQPLQRLVIDQEDPTRAFALAAAYSRSPGYGARQGPSGTLLFTPDGYTEYRSAPVNASSEPDDRPGDQPAVNRTQAQKEATEVVPKRGADSTSSSLSVASSGGRSDVAYPTDDESDMSTMPAMPPMATPPATDPEAPAPVGDPRYEATTPSPLTQDQPGRSRLIEEEAKGAARNTQGGESGLGLIRSAEQFVSSLNRLGAKGGVLTVAHGADLELPSTELAGAGTAPWRIEAEPGGRRPRLRFRPSGLVSRSAAAWAVMFQLRSGSLRLHGLDLVIQDQDQDKDASRSNRTAAIGVAAGSELIVEDCTITVAGRATSSTAIVVLQALPEIHPAQQESAPKDAVVIIRDVFLRSAGDGIHVSSGRRLDLQLQNALIAADGSFFHALGSSTLDRAQIALKLKIDHTLARARGGLVHLESTIDETELPLTEIVAENSTFSTAGQAPLFRVDGQGQMEALSDRIGWKAEKVAYDQIMTYRRDQTFQIGVSPRNYTRSDWRNAFNPKDESPLLDEVKFLNRLESGRPALSLTIQDLSLDPASPGSTSGPDLRLIPSAPPADF